MKKVVRFGVKRWLSCHWCRGRHRSDLCPNRGEPIKRYGTLGPNREYIPPRGVKVRILVIPNTVHGDQLTEMLKQINPKRR